jgi:PTS system ascorbate-specific IIA component
MIGVLIISHEPLATALLHCTRHVYGRLPQQVAALDVIPDEDPEQAAASARALAERINDGSGVLVLTDVTGATPSRIAAQLAEPYRVVVVAGVNLPLLLRSLTYRRGRELEALVEKVLPSARDAIEPVLPEVFDCGAVDGAADATRAADATPASDTSDDGSPSSPQTGRTSRVTRSRH